MLCSSPACTASTLISATGEALPQAQFPFASSPSHSRVITDTCRGTQRPYTGLHALPAQETLIIVAGMSPRVTWFPPSPLHCCPRGIFIVITMALLPILYPSNYLPRITIYLRASTSPSLSQVSPMEQPHLPVTQEDPYGNYILTRHKKRCPFFRLISVLFLCLDCDQFQYIYFLIKTCVFLSTIQWPVFISRHNIAREIVK